MDSATTTSRGRYVAAVATLAVIMVMLVPSVAHALSIGSNVASGVAGSEFTLTSDTAGWTANDEIRIRFGSDSGPLAPFVRDELTTANTTCKVTAGSTKEWSCTFRVPEGIADGLTTARAYVFKNSAYTFQVETAFTVTAPSITGLDLENNQLPRASSAVPVKVTATNLPPVGSGVNPVILYRGGAVTTTRLGNELTFTVPMADSSATTVPSGTEYLVAVRNGIAGSATSTSATMTVVESANVTNKLSVNKKYTDTTVGTGTTVTYISSVNNYGPDVAKNARLTWAIDEDVTNLEFCIKTPSTPCVWSAEPTIGGLTPLVSSTNSHEFTIGLGDRQVIAPGTPTYVWYHVRGVVADNSDGLNTTTLIAMDTARPLTTAAGGNSAPSTSNADVSSSADLTVTSFSSGVARLNKYVTFTVKFKNNGPAVAQNVAVDTDALTALLMAGTYQYKLGKGCEGILGTWTNFTVGDDISCGDVAGAASVQIRGKVPVTLGLAHALVSTVTVTPDNESNAANNSALYSVLTS